MQFNTNAGGNLPGAKKMLLPAIKTKTLSLTKREIAVMRLLCMDLSAKEIARALQITLNTGAGL